MAVSHPLCSALSKRGLLVWFWAPMNAPLAEHISYNYSNCNHRYTQNLERYAITAHLSVWWSILLQIQTYKQPRKFSVTAHFSVRRPRASVVLVVCPPSAWRSGTFPAPSVAESCPSSSASRALSAPAQYEPVSNSIHTSQLHHTE